MAIEYLLALSTSSNASSLLAAIHQQAGLPWSQDHTFLDGEGVQVSASALSTSYQELLEECFGPRFEVGATFRLSKDPKERQMGYQTMLKIVVGLLEQERGQAVLLFNYEIVVLQRFSEDLLLNLDWQSWQKQGTDLITLPYQLQSLPSPLTTE